MPMFRISIDGEGAEYFYQVGNKEQISESLENYFEGDNDSCIGAFVDRAKITVTDEDGNEVYSKYDLSDFVSETHKYEYKVKEGQYLLQLIYINKGSFLEGEIEDDEFHIEKFKINVDEFSDATYAGLFVYGDEEIEDEGSCSYPKYEDIIITDSKGNAIDYTEFYNPEE